MRYDLAFLLCCCKSFLGSEYDDDDNNDDIEANDGTKGSHTHHPSNPTSTATSMTTPTNKKNYNDYYALLAVHRSATPDELKRAYKRQSLQMHPDKLAQKGVVVTPELQTRFTKMKEAYEVLSDPHRRDTYDALGARGVKWLDEPFAMDPAVLAHNFAKSSTLDRSKIFAIFLLIAFALLVLPVSVCFHVDGRWGPNASWMATLTPLWIWNIVLILYHTRVILMGPIPRPEHVPLDEWVDPLPMAKRIFSLIRFLLIALWEILVACKLDKTIQVPWCIVCIPIYLWEATTLYKKWPLARMRIVTVEDLEAALGKPFSEFTPAEKTLIGQRYSVVQSTSSPDFDAAQKLKARARNDVGRSVVRILFGIVLLLQLDMGYDWNWWLVFAPIWILSLAVCWENYQAFAEVQRMATEKDPNLFAPASTPTHQANAYTAANVDPTSTTGSTYGAMGENGTESDPIANAPVAPTSNLTEEEKEQLRGHVAASSSKLCNKCCSQGFLLVILCLFVAKLQGAGFSAFWIISPFLFIAGILLCCIGCAIFGISEVSTDGINFDVAGDFAYTNAEAGTAAPNAGTAAAAAAVSDSIPTTTANAAYVPPPEAPVPAAALVAIPATTTAEVVSDAVILPEIPIVVVASVEPSASSVGAPERRTAASTEIVDSMATAVDVPLEPTAGHIYELD